MVKKFHLEPARLVPGVTILLKAMEVKLVDLEKKWAKVEGLDHKIADLEKHIRKLRGSMSQLPRPVSSKGQEVRYPEVCQGETLFRNCEGA